MLLPTVKEQPWPMPVPLPMVSVGRFVYRAANVKLHFPSTSTSSPIKQIAAALHPVNKCLFGHFGHSDGSRL